MAFKIIPKIKASQIEDRSLDTTFLKKYYKSLQPLLIKKTSPELKTDYFFCIDFAGDEHLLVMGNQTTAYKKVFKEAGKGKNGFDKANISIGSCFVLDENGKNILCIEANSSMSKGKKPLILKALKKMARAYFKQMSEVRWIDGPLMQDANDDEAVESANDGEGDNEGSSASGEQPEPLVKKDEIVNRTKELQKGIEKLKNDIIPRFKKRETSDRDAAFVKALRKAGLLFISKLSQTDETTSQKFADQKDKLEKVLPKWMELESKISEQKSKSEATAALKKELKGAVERMNTTRGEIKKLLKRVKLKQLV